MSFFFFKPDSDDLTGYCYFVSYVTSLFPAIMFRNEHNLAVSRQFRIYDSFLVFFVFRHIVPPPTQLFSYFPLCPQKLFFPPLMCRVRHIFPLFLATVCCFTFFPPSCTVSVTSRHKSWRQCVHFSAKMYLVRLILKLFSSIMHRGEQLVGTP